MSLVLLVVYLGVLWLAGGASRADALGQVVVRSVAWIALIIVILFGARPSFGGMKPVLLLLAGAVLLTLLQLVPLPPGIWQALPGRAFFMEAAAASGQEQPWRPWSLVPGATVNAASSLIVPIVALVLVAGLKEAERSWLPGLVLSLIVGSTFLGLLQFSGAGFNNPLINDTAGQVSGIFANRNHFALFAAFGCMLAPVWAFLDGRQPQWRGPAALGLVLLFALTILATGSRAGLLLGALGLGLGLVMVGEGIRRELRRYPRWVFLAILAGIVGTIVIFVLISIAADRAAAIERVLDLDAGQDLRARTLPTVLDLIRDYFPAGSGLGGFDPIFRKHEPFDLLKLNYFNHAHNDFLEIAIDAGLVGILLLAAGLLWWGLASVRAWRVGVSPRHAVPKLGSAMLLLILIASIIDYPARTPMIMAVIVIAGVWLCERAKGSRGSALPGSGQPL
ncbi:O-antigen ligase family protein [Sphingomonas sp. ID1715]|uniref:O-antigen ligase family protein n=1 Tax=Sphingomonas sp. ID1715 TaxID=1656898 RepID=UPI001799095A|nr:O-antigen ligase family protein [Sphingomonas sp. ID1715]NNM78589.1 O-antigen ligase family protein [Sphingomonas sp. ID1715]